MFLRMIRSSKSDAALLAISRLAIAESRRLLASSWSERVSGRQDTLVERSRASIGESRRLLEAVEASATHSGEAPTIRATLSTAGAEMDRDPAALSVNVFAEGARFRWTVCSPSEEILGRGTAETELKARAAAFYAGMIYLDWVKHRASPGKISLH